MSWLPHAGLKNTSNDGVGTRGVLVSQTFTPKGQFYPRLTLCVREAVYSEGFSLSCNIKMALDSWWDKHGIPEELLGVAAQMLTEVIRMKADERNRTDG